MAKKRLALETLAAVIARSQIILAQIGAAKQPEFAQRFPGGFEAVDVAILDWIAAEGRRIGGRLVWM